MFEFHARDYVELTYQIGLLIGNIQEKQPSAEIIGEQWGNLLRSARALGLTATKAHLDAMMEELLEANPGKIKVDSQGQIEWPSDVEVDANRVCHHLDAAYVTLKAELGAIAFRAIAAEKKKYCDPEWLINSPIYLKFPDTVDEFQRAGRCYAYGENTACVFHLMRVADFCLKKVAESLGIQYDARNWHGISQKISSNMEQKYQLKTEEWKKAQPFYAEILTDIQALGRSHRNPVLHELEKKYDEREAQYMLVVIEKFADHVANRLS